MAYIKLALAFILSITQIITPFFSIAFSGGTKNLGDEWSETQEFTADYAVEIKKDPSKDFVILNLADIQWNADSLFDERGEYTRALITQAIEKQKPNLITLTGDNSSSHVGYIELIKFLDSFGIPWAPVMGNHDGDNGNVTMEAWDSLTLLKSKYCLFKIGPKGMGYGNYVINITENGKIIHSLIMMDTHSEADDTKAGEVNMGDNGASGYDHLWANQIAWYKWVIKGIEKIAGAKVSSTVYYHIPNIEFRIARDELCKSEEDKWNLKEENSNLGFGSLDENICSPEGNNGFFDLVKELDSTRNIIVGHDHVNNLVVNYEGVNLCYGLKTGNCSYSSEDKQGTSSLVINGRGDTSFSHNYYE